jgi:hypothetical protein
VLGGGAAPPPPPNHPAPPFIEMTFLFI